VIGDTSGQIKIYGYSSLSLVNSFKAHSKSISRIKQSPFNTNTNYVATSSDDATVKIWNFSSSFNNWTLIRTYSQHSFAVLALEWLDNDTLASAGVYDKTIKLWSLTTGQTKRTIQTNQSVNSLKLLNTNIHLAAGLGNGDINIYNKNDGNLVSSLKGHTSGVFDLVQLSADLLASSGGDDKVRIWNLTTNTCKFNLTGHTRGVYGLKQITPSILASGSSDRKIILWNITSGLLIRTLRGHWDWIDWSVDLLNSQTLVSGSTDGIIKLWNWSTGECLSTIQTTGSRIGSLAVINMKTTSKFCHFLFNSFFTVQFFYLLISFRKVFTRPVNLSFLSDYDPSNIA
jgi:WD40 repeat protein